MVVVKLVLVPQQVVVAMPMSIKHVLLKKLTNQPTNLL